MKSLVQIPFTQTKEYLSWHIAVNTKTFYKDFFRDEKKNKDEIEFQIDNENEKVQIATAACVVLNLKIGKVLYVPYGPVFFDADRNERTRVFCEIYEYAKKEDCVFVRIESPFEVKGKTSENSLYDHKKAATSRNVSGIQAECTGHVNYFHLSFTPPIKTYVKEGIFQPRAEWWLGLNEDEEQLLNRIHKDHRYSIRRAEREGVRVEIARENLLKYSDIFYDLLKTTAKRDGFTLYERAYYEQALSSFRGSKLKKFLVFTKLGEEYLSVAFVVISGEIANLVFAGSKNERRELGFNHLMQWSAILESKKHACLVYNFGGITDGVYGKPGLKGVTDFKKKFGGYKKLHNRFQDLPIKKLKYFLYILRKIF